MLPAVCLVLAAAGVGPVAGPQTATEPAVPGEELVARGRFLYEIYCLDCHGETGKGNGSVARERQIRPTDLTRLSPGDRGEFPLLELYEVIDGRTEVEEHVRRDMPVWGLAFQEFDTDINQQNEVRGRILQLIHYLRSIQVETTEPDDRQKGNER
jgi:hypothetical protein